MAELILTPPFAFGIYAVLVGILYLAGKSVAVRGKANVSKENGYASGEKADLEPAAPGYRPFFVVALFFAILHLGVLMLGTSRLEPVTIVYIGGLMLALLALILG
jgi:NADH:ubiquinone oxidoreductase subunit 3 (subunit A)